MYLNDNYYLIYFSYLYIYIYDVTLVYFDHHEFISNWRCLRKGPIVAGRPGRGGAARRCWWVAMAIGSMRSCSWWSRACGMRSRRQHSFETFLMEGPLRGEFLWGHVRWFHSLWQTLNRLNMENQQFWWKNYGKTSCLMGQLWKIITFHGKIHYFYGHGFNSHVIL